MADMKIEEATLAESITGTDVVPAAVGENPAPRKVTMEQIKNFVVSALAAMTGEVTIPDDFAVFISKSNATGNDTVTKITPALLGDEIARILFENAASTLLGTDKVIVQSVSGTTAARNTTTIDDILAYVKANIGDVMDIAGLTAATDVENTDAIPSSQTRSGTESNKKVTVGQVAAKTIADMTDTTFVPEITGEVGTEDKLLVDRGGVLKKVVLGTSGIKKGGVTGPSTTTADKIPQWANNSGALKDGKTVVTSVGASGSAGNDNIPTEAAVRSAVDSCAKKPSSTTENKIPQWSDANGTLKDGMAIATSSDHDTVSDGHIPTFRLLKDEIAARSSEQPGYISGIAEIASPTSGYEGELRVCKVKVGETYVGDALFIWRGGVWRWDFVSWLKSSMPTESETLSTLFYGKGSALPTTGSTVKKSQLFILSGNATAGADGLYVAMADAPDPGWVKLGS